jgi:hypothetical protein
MLVTLGTTIVTGFFTGITVKAYGDWNAAIAGFACWRVAINLGRSTIP